MHCDYTIIGAGVVGLAVARAIAKRLPRSRTLAVLDKEDSFGRGVSCRNSEVIHSGIYYPTGSLKHRLCVRGRRLIYDYCSARGIAHLKCGKLIVSTDESEDGQLAAVIRQAELNEVENIAVLDRSDIVRLEPSVRASRALLSHETGILDAHGLMKSMVNDVTDRNGMVAYRTTVTAVERVGGAWRLLLSDGTVFSTDRVINAAGLGAVAVAAMAGMKPEAMHPCKGSYFSYSGRHDVRHLVYPVPHANLAGLGVHATLDLGGRLKFGPDVEYVKDVDDFSVDPKKRDSFYEAARMLFKGLLRENLVPEMAGIRPKIQGPGDAVVKDFYIREESGQGCPGFINLLGIESPGLTSSMAIAEEGVGLLDGV